MFQKGTQKGKSGTDCSFVFPDFNWDSKMAATNVYVIANSRIRVDMLSHESKTTEIQGQYDWRAEKNLDRGGVVLILAFGRPTVKKISSM